jgi:HK97 family phage major capsid protein
MLAQIKALREEAQRILAEGGDNISAEAIELAESKANEADALEAKAQKLADINARLGAAPVAQSVKSGPVSITNHRENFESDPKAGFKHAQEMLAVIAKNRGQAGSDKRLNFLAAVGSDEQSTVSGEFGGFAIPKALYGEVMKVMPEGDPTANLCRNIPMESPSVSINARVDKNHSTSVVGGLQVYRTGELNALTSSRQSMEQIDLKAEDLNGLTYVSKQLLNASPATVASILSDFPAAFAEKEFREKISGTGVGQFEGVLNSAALITVAKESAQTAGTVVTKNIGKMMSRCYNYESASVAWLINHDVLPELMDLGGSDKNIFSPSAIQGITYQLYGKPVIVTDKAAALGSAGDIMLINWSEYLVGTYGSEESAESIHVRFEYNESAFKFYKANDGRGWWKSVLTPKAGSTKSPFIILGARA